MMGIKADDGVIGAELVDAACLKKKKKKKCVVVIFFSHFPLSFPMLFRSHFFSSSNKPARMRRHKSIQKLHPALPIGIRALFLLTGEFHPNQ